MQTKQFKLISIAVLAITLFSGQLFGMDIKMDIDNVRIGDFCDENNITKAGNFLTLSQDLWKYQIIPQMLNHGNAVKAPANLKLFSRTCRKANNFVQSNYTSRAITLKLANDLIDNGHVWKVEDNLEAFLWKEGYGLEKDESSSKFRFNLKYEYRTINLSKATYKQLEDLLKILTPITFFNLQRALTFQASKPGQRQPIAIDLGGNNIGDEGVQAIAEALEKNTTLKTINLGGNNIGDEGVQAIAEALEKNTTLKTINLRWNKIGDEGAQAIAKALKKNTTLKTINLRWNKIGDEGIQAIAEALEKNTTLKTIDLSGNNIGDEGAKNIAEALKENSTLTTIDLEFNDIGAEGAQAIAEALKKNSTLETINLWGNNIGDEGAKNIAEALKENITLKNLDLELTFIGAEGAKAIAEALRRNRNL